MVEVRTDADPDKIITGHISHIGELLDEETRAVQVLITCNNEDRKLKPGMFTSVHFINQSKMSILVPVTALLQNEENTYVFVRGDKNMFVKRKIKVTTADQSLSLITEGIKTGDVIVSEGGIFLMAN